MRSLATSPVLYPSSRPMFCARGYLLLVALLSLVGCGKDRAAPSMGKPTEKYDSSVEPRNQDAAALFDAASPLVLDGSSTVSAEAGIITSGDPPNAPDAQATPLSLCDKYGGAESVGKVVSDYVVPAIIQDCRINAYFAALSEPGVQRVGECLSIQVQELFGCTGVTYAGSRASNGLPCRSMAKAHIGLQISQGDFDALIEDVVSALSAAGVTAEDIGLAAPALLGTQEDIVEQPTSAPALSACE